LFSLTHQQMFDWKLKNLTMVMYQRKTKKLKRNKLLFMSILLWIL
jgi:hypothetical protein